jgi:hypothetical protein
MSWFNMNSSKLSIYSSSRNCQARKKQTKTRKNINKILRIFSRQLKRIKKESNKIVSSQRRPDTFIRQKLKRRKSLRRGEKWWSNRKPRLRQLPVSENSNKCNVNWCNVRMSTLRMLILRKNRASFKFDWRYWL